MKLIEKKRNRTYGTYKTYRTKNLIQKSKIKKLVRVKEQKGQDDL